MLTNPSFYIDTVIPVNGNNLIVNWEFCEGSYLLFGSANVLIAAYVTTKKLGDRAIYYDTDSVVNIFRIENMD